MPEGRLGVSCGVLMAKSSQLYDTIRYYTIRYDARCWGLARGVDGEGREGTGMDWEVVWKCCKPVANPDVRGKGSKRGQRRSGVSIRAI